VQWVKGLRGSRDVAGTLVEVALAKTLDAVIRASTSRFTHASLHPHLTLALPNGLAHQYFGGLPTVLGNAKLTVHLIHLVLKPCLPLLVRTSATHMRRRPSNTHALQHQLYNDVAPFTASQSYFEPPNLRQSFWKPMQCRTFIGQSW
jgi:hypothetical protein